MSLLARLELAGADLGDRWQDLADYLVARTRDQVLPFLDLQYLYGLARAGRPEADVLMANIETFCAITPFSAPDATGSARNGTFTITADGAAADVWRHVCLPAGRGLLAHARGDYANAVAMLGIALPRLMEIGGSHAQRDLFEQIHLDSLIRSGRWSAAQQVVQQRLGGQPESIRLRRQARQVYAALGLDGISAP